MYDGDLAEVAMEKMRAVLTRPAIKERDLLDLFLISKKIDMAALQQEKIVEKIQSAASFVKGLSARIKQNLEIISRHRHSVLEEKSQLVLIAIDEKEYAHFEKKIMPLLIEIGKKSLMNLK